MRRLACLFHPRPGHLRPPQEVGSRVPRSRRRRRLTASALPGKAKAPDADFAADDSTSDEPPTDIVDRFFSIFSQKEDPDGPINTDRPTFTPANTVVPPGRLQFESGFTYNRQQSPTATNNLYDLPEIAMRYGLMDRVEFRMFWEGPTFASSPSSGRPRANRLGGTSDTEIGFKWQLFAGRQRPEMDPDDRPDHINDRARPAAPRRFRPEWPSRTST